MESEATTDKLTRGHHSTPMGGRKEKKFQQQVLWGIAEGRKEGGTLFANKTVPFQRDPPQQHSSLPLPKLTQTLVSSGRGTLDFPPRDMFLE